MQVFHKTYRRYQSGAMRGVGYLAASPKTNLPNPPRFAPESHPSHNGLVASSRALPVLMPIVPNQRWSCHSCGDCCRVLVGHLFDQDRERIDRQGWDSNLDRPPYVRIGRNWVLNKRPDGACVFLDENNLCRIHSRFGEAAKPFACRIFPFSIRPVSGGWRASFRFDCPSAAGSKGKPIAQYGTWLKELAQKLDHPGRTREDTADLQPGVAGNAEETEALVEKFCRWLQNSNVPVWIRIAGAARVTATLDSATLSQVRGQRFAELLHLLLSAAEGEALDPFEQPTARQRGLLRQLILAHVEHVSVEEAAGGPWRRCMKRWEQLRRARRMLRGRGRVPELPGFPAATTITFDDVELRENPGPNATDIEDLVIRYAIARLQGRTCFGEGFYGWPATTGLGALWLIPAAAGWLARLRGLSENRRYVRFDDFAAALGALDRAATRLPAPGTWAERIRIGYLMKADGIARLLRAFLPIRWDLMHHDEEPTGKSHRTHSPAPRRDGESD